jgi:hypothetical protein
MEIKNSHENQLRNDEHFQKMTETKDAIEVAGAETLKIKDQYDTFLTCYIDEDTALKKIVKSATTSEMETADHGRDGSFRGLVNSIKAALDHYERDVVKAAYRLKVVSDTFGNLAAKPINEETSGIYNFVQELDSAKYAGDVATVGLTGHVRKLDADNRAFDALSKSRDDENAVKTQLKMKQCRAATDRAYNAIVKQINALILVEGKEPYIAFVNKMNTFIDRFNNAVAQRAGRAKAKKAKDSAADDE